MYRIRSATLADISHIVHHREQMFRDMGIECAYGSMLAAFEPWTREALASGLYRGWLAESGDGIVVGGAGMTILPWPPGPQDQSGRCGFVYNVYVAPDHRRQGLARRLMETLHAWCRDEGVRLIGLNASHAGQPLYEALGYRHVNHMFAVIE